MPGASASGTAVPTASVLVVPSADALGSSQRDGYRRREAPGTGVVQAMIFIDVSWSYVIISIPFTLSWILIKTDLNYLLRQPKRSLENNKSRPSERAQD